MLCAHIYSDLHSAVSLLHLLRACGVLIQVRFVLVSSILPLKFSLAWSLSHPAVVLDAVV